MSVLIVDIETTEQLEFWENSAHNVNTKSWKYFITILMRHRSVRDLMMWKYKLIANILPKLPTLSQCLDNNPTWHKQLFFVIVVKCVYPVYESEVKARELFVFLFWKIFTFLMPIHYASTICTSRFYWLKFHLYPSGGNLMSRKLC